MGTIEIGINSFLRTERIMLKDSISIPRSRRPERSTMFVMRSRISLGTATRRISISSLAPVPSRICQSRSTSFTGTGIYFLASKGIACSSSDLGRRGIVSVVTNDAAVGRTQNLCENLENFIIVVLKKSSASAASFFQIRAREKLTVGRENRSAPIRLELNHFHGVDANINSHDAA